MLSAAKVGFKPTVLVEQARQRHPYDNRLLVYIGLRDDDVSS